MKLYLVSKKKRVEVGDNIFPFYSSLHFHPSFKNRRSTTLLPCAFCFPAPGSKTRSSNPIKSIRQHWRNPTNPPSSRRLVLPLRSSLQRAELTMRLVYNQPTHFLTNQRLCAFRMLANMKASSLYLLPYELSRAFSVSSYCKFSRESVDQINKTPFLIFKRISRWSITSNVLNLVLDINATYLKSLYPYSTLNSLLIKVCLYVYICDSSQLLAFLDSGVFYVLIMNKQAYS